MDEQTENVGSALKRVVSETSTDYSNQMDLERIEPPPPPVVRMPSSNNEASTTHSSFSDRSDMKRTDSRVSTDSSSDSHRNGSGNWGWFEDVHEAETKPKKKGKKKDYEPTNQEDNGKF